jgi:hypothetical protein
MQWRMLEYMPRLASTYRLDLESVVLYIGRGAGADDTGLYEVHGLDGTPVLAWRYRVIRLWQMPAEALSLCRVNPAPVASLVMDPEMGAVGWRIGRGGTACHGL